MFHLSSYANPSQSPFVSLKRNTSRASICASPSLPNFIISHISFHQLPLVTFPILLLSVFLLPLVTDSFNIVTSASVRIPASKWAWAAYCHQQHLDYFESGIGVDRVSNPELKPTLALIWSLSCSVLASSGREKWYGVTLRNERLAWQKKQKKLNQICGDKPLNSGS